MSMKSFYKVLFLTLFATWGFAQNPLLIPETLSGETLHLTLQNGTYSFIDDLSTPTMGVNGNILGPTLILDQGQEVSIQVTNQLEETTTIHWHGLHVAPENDGGPHTPIPPNTTWNPVFTVLDKAGTYWYHPHLHEKTDEHVSKGIAGMIIVREPEEAALALPRSYGVDDIPIVLQTKDFDEEGQIVVHSNQDDVVMVNATIDPVINLPAQVVRLRLLNGASQRAFHIGLSNNQPFFQIASDGGLLAAPVNMTRLLLAPGERAEILVDLGGLNGQSTHLMSYASELPNGIYGATSPGMAPVMTLDGYNPNPLNGTNFELLQIHVQEAQEEGVFEIPSALVSVSAWNEADATVTRNLLFTPASPGPNQLNGSFRINNQSFDLQVVNYTIPLGNTEIWEIRNQSGIAHPFHIHDVQFYILDRNGVQPLAHERGRKDVVLIRPMETVRFITKFEDFSNEDVPYMYHCHLLTHEDDGMMGQFLVVDNTTSTDELNENVVRLYPNPATDILTIQATSPSYIEIYDALGRLVDQKEVSTTNEELDLSSLAAGVFYLHVLHDGRAQVFKVIKH